jgi:hydroxymethylpyrimidine pyrophosphatase-like HAD family hydrolase
MSKSNQHPVRNVIILTDIDDTLCHTVGKFRKYVGNEKALGDACVFDKNGTPLSFRSDKQTTFLAWMKLAATIIPITGRSTEKYLNVDLGFDSYAITAFGAVILNPDGTPDPIWQAHIETNAAKSAEALSELTRLVMGNRVSESVKSTVVSENDVRLFLKVYDDGGSTETIDAMAELMARHLPEGWRLHHNEGQLCAYPEYLDKIKAAQYLLAQIAGPDTLVIGAGDSLSDSGFMSVCDFMIAPIQSQIFKSIKS